jgi:hypothetical protein
MLPLGATAVAVAVAVHVADHVNVNVNVKVNVKVSVKPFGAVVATAPRASAPVPHTAS